MNQVSMAQTDARAPYRAEFKILSKCSSHKVSRSIFLLLSDEEAFNNNKAEGKSCSSNWKVNNIQQAVVLLMQSMKCIYAGTQQIQLIQNGEVFIPLDNFLLKEDVLDVPTGDHSPELPRTELSSSSFASKEFLYQINGCHSSPLQGSGSAIYLCK